MWIEPGNIIRCAPALLASNELGGHFSNIDGKQLRKPTTEKGLAAWPSEATFAVQAAACASFTAERHARQDANPEECAHCHDHFATVEQLNSHLKNPKSKAKCARQKQAGVPKFPFADTLNTLAPKKSRLPRSRIATIARCLVQVLESTVGQEEGDGNDDDDGDDDDDDASGAAAPAGAADVAVAATPAKPLTRKEKKRQRARARRTAARARRDTPLDTMPTSTTKTLRVDLKTKRRDM
jgi:hypothetical protein